MGSKKLSPKTSRKTFLQSFQVQQNKTYQTHREMQSFLGDRHKKVIRFKKHKKPTEKPEEKNIDSWEIKKQNENSKLFQTYGEAQRNDDFVFSSKTKNARKARINLKTSRTDSLKIQQINKNENSPQQNVPKL